VVGARTRTEDGNGRSVNARRKQRGRRDRLGRDYKMRRGVGAAASEVAGKGPADQAPGRAVPGAGDHSARAALPGHGRAAQQLRTGEAGSLASGPLL
jgi:hypothetical protein